MSIEVDNAGPTGVSMIEPDHLNPTLHKPTNQRIRAKDPLSSRPHNHQNSGKPRIPDPVSPNPQRSGGHKSLASIQHGGTVAAACCRTPTFYRWSGRRSAEQVVASSPSLFLGIAAELEADVVAAARA
ncbi:MULTISPECIES: hypothetical protein [Kribbella]|uniref:hypothetical protein n=1 Tax=Kribbella TaxID=182639 RepID=UPI001F5409A8|nr:MULTISPECIES: hypothetical protein [Kribbella]